MWKIFIKDICNILLLSHIQTTWNQLSTKKTDLRDENWDLSREAENFYKMGICYILMLSLAHTKRNQLSTASFWLAVHPFFQERSSLIGLFIFVHKLAVELKGKLQDDIPVSALYVKNAIVLQMESLQNEAPFWRERGTSLRLVDSWLQYVGTKESMTDELTLNDSKNAIASLMKSMQPVSRSGEKGGMTDVGGK